MDIGYGWFAQGVWAIGVDYAHGALTINLFKFFIDVQRRLT